MLLDLRWWTGINLSSLYFLVACLRALAFCLVDSLVILVTTVHGMCPSLSMFLLTPWRPPKIGLQTDFREKSNFYVKPHIFLQIHVCSISIWGGWIRWQYFREHLRYFCELVRRFLKLEKGFRLPPPKDLQKPACKPPVLVILFIYSSSCEKMKCVVFSLTSYFK